MRTIILIALTLISSRVKGQDVEKSDLYKSFYKNFIIPSDIAESRSHYIFSIRLTTNEHGQVSSSSASASMDSIFKKRIDHWYKVLNKKSSTSFGWKNSVLILPVYIFNTTPGINIDYESMQLNESWNFSNDNTLIIKDAKLLPPVVIYYRKGKAIEN